MNVSVKYFCFIVLVFIVACFLRFYRLADYPVGFHIDEASLGYNGYSFLRTGSDEHGNKFPLYIDMFGDYRPSGYHYLTIVPIAAFGLNEFSTRFPGALYGSLTVFSIYLFSLVIFENRKLALICSFFVAIAPWHVSLSRASAETVVALFFIILGFALVLQAIKKRSSIFLIFGSLSLGLSYFFYHTPRIFVPLIFLTIVFLNAKVFLRYFRENKKRFVFTTVGASLTLLMLTVLLIFGIKGGNGRFLQVSIFGFPETKLVLEEQIRENGTQATPVLVTRFFHNKIINYTLTYISNYFEYYSGEYLFMRGGLPVWYKIPNIGLIYLVEAPFFIAGFILLFKAKIKFGNILIFWFFLAPMIAAVTYDDSPNIQRSIIMFPIIEMIAAYGLYQIIHSSNKLYFFTSLLFFSALTLNMSYFLHQYMIHGKTHNARFRNNGFKEMVMSIHSSYNQFDHFIVTKSLGGIYPSVLFYMKYDPAIYQGEGSPKDKDYGGFGKVFFVPQACPSMYGDNRYPTSGKIMYVNSGICDITDKSAQKIYREDGTIAFIMVYR